jgi:probable rRNA maturation factor
VTDSSPDDDDLGSVPPPRRHRPLGGTGAADVFAANEQSSDEVDTSRWMRLAQQVLGAEGVGRGAELNLLFVDEAAMTELNERWLGGEGPTDVLAFPIDDDIEIGRSPDAGTTGPDRKPAEPSEAPLVLGDVVICPSVARKNAPEHAGTYDDELALLVVHGILHLLGMDHADDEEAAAMQARERGYLDRFHRG